MSQPDILTDKKERSDFYIALLVILIAGAFVWHSALGGGDDISLGDQIIADADIGADDVAHIYESEEELDQTGGYHTNSKVSSVFPKRELDVDESVGEGAMSQIEMKDDVPDLAVDEKEKTMEVADEEAPSTKEEQNSLRLLSDESHDKVDQMQEEVVASAEEVKIVEKLEEKIVAAVPRTVTRSSGETRTCHISVGLYKDPSNVSQLKSRLELQGFDVYTKNIKRTTQVGVYVACDSDEAESILSEIRADFAKDAFIEEYH